MAKLSSTDIYGDLYVDGIINGKLNGSLSGNADSASKVNNKLILKLNGGTTEGTNLFTFDGSGAKTVNITPSSIGAFPSSGGDLSGPIFLPATATSTNVNHPTQLAYGMLGSYGTLKVLGNTDTSEGADNEYVHIAAGWGLSPAVDKGITVYGTYANCFGQRILTATHTTSHAPANAQKNSDITKAEIEAKLTGDIATHNHQSLTGLSGSSWTTATRNIQTDCKFEFSSHISKSATGLFPTGDNSNAMISFNRHSGHYDSQLGFNSNGKIYYRHVDGNAMTDSTAWQQIYTSANKPTPADIGAAPSSHTHDYAPSSHNHTSLAGVTSITFGGIDSSDTMSITTSASGATSYMDFHMSDDANTDMWRWRFTAWDGGSNASAATFNAMTLKATSTTKSQLVVNGNITADSFTGNASSVNGLTFWTGTQDQYDALPSKSATTVYLIKE